MNLGEVWRNQVKIAMQGRKRGMEEPGEDSDARQEERYGGTQAGTR